MIIAICGKKGSGKDTIGNYLCEKFNFIKLNFADPLKEACRNIFDLTDEQLYGDKKETIDEYWNTTPREIMQFVGTDLLRFHMKDKFPEIKNNIWVMLMEKKIINILRKNPNQHIVIADLRFINEYNLINKFGGIVFKVTKNNLYDIVGLTHQSEIEMNEIKYKYLIENNLSIDSLYETTNKIMESIIT